MLYREMSTRFKNIVETDDIRTYIHIGMVDTIPNTCLSREIDHNTGFVICKDLINEVLVCQIALDEDVFDGSGFGGLFD